MRTSPAFATTFAVVVVAAPATYTLALTYPKAKPAKIPLSR
jgi:hypothetical protein